MILTTCTTWPTHHLCSLDYCDYLNHLDHMDIQDSLDHLDQLENPTQRRPTALPSTTPLTPKLPTPTLKDASMKYQSCSLFEHLVEYR